MTVLLSSTRSQVDLPMACRLDPAQLDQAAFAPDFAEDIGKEQAMVHTWRTWLIRTPLGWALSFVLAAAGGYLLITHTGHVLGALPYLLLLACPLMHVFGHGGHGHHRHDGKN